MPAVEFIQSPIGIVSAFTGLLAGIVWAWSHAAMLGCFAMNIAWLFHQANELGAAGIGFEDQSAFQRLLSLPIKSSSAFFAITMIAGLLLSAGLKHVLNSRQVGEKK